MAWIINSLWHELDTIEKGNIVHIKNDDGLGFLLKGIVSKSDGNKISVHIEASFGINGEGEILDGSSSMYVNKELEFEKSRVHKIIKKT